MKLASSAKKDYIFIFFRCWNTNIHNLTSFIFYAAFDVKSKLSGTFECVYIERVFLKIKLFVWDFYGRWVWKNAFLSCKFETIILIYFRNKVCHWRHGQKVTFYVKFMVREICLTLRSSFSSIAWHFRKVITGLPGW